MNTMNGTVAIVVAALMGQALAAEDPVRTKGAAAMEFMKDSARIYRVHRSARDEPLELQDEPAFRLGNQFTGVVEGAIFFWLDDESRPEAAVQIFELQYAGAPEGQWIHSFSSLSPGTIAVEREGRTVWNPATPGVEFKPVPGAPGPAESAAQRSRQMRALAQNFHASDNFRKNGWLDLRLPPTPIARYGKPGTRVLAGALFAFVEGTDSEVFLFLEARSGNHEAEWQFALAPMTVFAVKASYQGKTVWELPDRKPAKDPAKPFFDYVDKTVRP